jgi:predicted enzyme related to lactoylglutathione lyase
MANSPVVWFEIYVEDMERAKRFYEQVFNVKLERLPTPEGSEGIEMWSFPSSMEGPGAGGTICKMEGFTAGRNSVIVYFACDDVSVEAGRVEAAGGRIQQAKKSIGQFGFMALVQDTEGNMIGLHSMK